MACQQNGNAPPFLDSEPMVCASYDIHHGFWSSSRWSLVSIYEWEALNALLVRPNRINHPEKKKMPTHSSSLSLELSSTIGFMGNSVLTPLTPSPFTPSPLP